MEWYELLTVIGGIAVPIVIAICAERRSIKRLDKHLGFGDDEASLKRQIDDKLGQNNKSVAEQIGVNADTPSLTVQHSEIKKALVEQNSQICEIANLITESNITVQKRLDKLKGRQKDIKGKISDISDVIEDWQRLAAKCDEQAELIFNLNLEITRLNEKLAEYESDNQCER